MIERWHQKFKQIIEINVKRDSLRYNTYVNFAVMAHTTTNHQAIKSSPTEIFHDIVPFKSIELKFTNRIQGSRARKDIVTPIDQINEKYETLADNVLEPFHKYKWYYDSKPLAELFKVSDFAFLLNPNFTTHSNKAKLQSFYGFGPYKVKNKLSDSNYIIQWVGLDKMQSVRRMRLRKLEPNDENPDVPLDDAQPYPEPYAAHNHKIFDA